MQAALEAQLQVELQQQEGQEGDVQGDVQRVVQGGQQKVTGRRRRAGARGAARGVTDTGAATFEEPSLPVQHEVASTAAQAQSGKPMLSNAAVSAAATATAEATAVAAAPASRRRSEGNSVVARVPSAAQNSMVQPWAQAGVAPTLKDDSGMAQGVQLRRVGGSKVSRKRAAEDDNEEHAAKRWQGDVVGNASKTPSLGAGVNAARILEGGRNSMEIEQVDVGMDEDGVAVHTKTAFESAVRRQRMDEWGHA